VKVGSLAVYNAGFKGHMQS